MHAQQRQHSPRPVPTLGGLGPAGRAPGRVEVGGRRPKAGLLLAEGVLLLARPFCCCSFLPTSSRRRPHRCLTHGARRCPAPRRRPLPSETRDRGAPGWVCRASGRCCSHVRAPSSECGGQSAWAAARRCVRRHADGATLAGSSRWRASAWPSTRRSGSTTSAWPCATRRDARCTTPTSSASSGASSSCSTTASALCSSLMAAHR
jgi:hypothetical protein